MLKFIYYSLMSYVSHWIIYMLCTCWLGTAMWTSAGVGVGLLTDNLKRTMRTSRNTENHKKYSVQDALISFLTNELYNKHWIRINMKFIQLISSSWGTYNLFTWHLPLEKKCITVGRKTCNNFIRRFWEEYFKIMSYTIKITIK